MSDIGRNFADLPTAIVGATTAGVPTTPVNSSANGDLYSRDVINVSLTSGGVSVTTTAVPARVGASNLSNRKLLQIYAPSAVVYLGSSSSVTTTTGIPIFPGQVVTYSFTDGVTPYLIAAVSTSVVILEGS